MAGHNERLGPSQFRDLLSMLQVDITAHEAMRMFRRMVNRHDILLPDTWLHSSK